MDAVRLPKQIYFAHRVIQNEQPDIHILGHWSYPSGPDAKKTVKTIYVIANTETVELMVNDKSAGVNSHAQSVELPAGGRAGGMSTQPASRYIFAFPNVEFAPGSLKAIGRNNGKPVAQAELTTAGLPAQIRLTPITGPLGLQADGQDAALIDVEVVDARGQRCPTDDGKDRLHHRRPRHLARRLQQRQGGFHQQSLPEHGMRHQPRLAALHLYGRHDYGHGQPSGFEARADSSLSPSRSR